jgi:hypothetical protein
VRDNNHTDDAIGQPVKPRATLSKIAHARSDSSRDPFDSPDRPIFFRSRRCLQKIPPSNIAGNPVPTLWIPLTYSPAKQMSSPLHPNCLSLVYDNPPRENDCQLIPSPPAIHPTLIPFLPLTATEMSRQNLKKSRFASQTRV